MAWRLTLLRDTPAVSAISGRKKTDFLVNRLRGCLLLQPSRLIVFDGFLGYPDCHLSAFFA
jgi:hypothetical protein